MQKKFEWVRYAFIVFGIIGAHFGLHTDEGTLFSIFIFILMSGLVWTGCILGDLKSKRDEQAKEYEH